MTGAAFHHVVTPKSSQESDIDGFQFEEDLQLIQGFVIEFVLAVFFVFALFSVFFPRCTKCCEGKSGKSWKIGCVYALCVMIDVCIALALLLSILYCSSKGLFI